MNPGANVLLVEMGSVFSAALCCQYSVPLSAVWGSGLSVAKVSFSELSLLFLRSKGEILVVKIQHNVSSKNIHLETMKW